MAKKDYPRALLEFRNAARMMPKDAEPAYQSGLAYLGTQNIPNAVAAFRRAVELDPNHGAAQLKLAELMTASRNKDLIQKAAAQLEALLAGSPDNLDAIYTLASAEYKLGKTEDAASRLEVALRKFPTHLRSSVALAQLKLGQKDFDGAEDVLRKAVNSAPQSSLAVFALGQLYMLSGHPGEGESEIKKALQLEPKNAQALLSLAAIQTTGKRIVEAEETYRKLSALSDNAYRSLHALFIFKLGRTDDAITELEKLVKEDPNDRTVRNSLVAMYLALDKLPAAESLLAAVLRHNRKDSDALLQQSVVYLKLGKPAEAESNLNTLLHANPDSAEGHLALSAVYKAKGLQKSEDQELNDALRLKPGLLQARLTLARNLLMENQGKSALEVLANAPDAQRGEPRLIRLRNWVWLKQGNFREVRTTLDQVLPLDQNPEFVLQDAILKMEQGNYVGARVGAEEVLRIEPVNVQAARLVMESYASQKQAGKGIQRLIELAAAHPKSATLLGLLGTWYLRIGKPTDARKAFEAAKAADAKYLDADLALADLDHREQRLEAARRRMASVVAMDPRNLQALLGLASLDAEAGDRKSAISRYRAALDIDSSNLMALNNLAYTLGADHPDEALKFAQKAAEAAPDNPTVQDTLGWIFYRKGMYTTATNYLKRAVSKEPTPRRQFHLGMSYIKSGDQATGRSMLQAALLKDPNLTRTEQGW